MSAPMLATPMLTDEHTNGNQVLLAKHTNDCIYPMIGLEVEA
jgi:hypothetical protein